MRHFLENKFQFETTNLDYLYLAIIYKLPLSKDNYFLYTCSNVASNLKIYCHLDKVTNMNTLCDVRSESERKVMTQIIVEIDPNIANESELKEFLIMAVKTQAKVYENCSTHTKMNNIAKYLVEHSE